MSWYSDFFPLPRFDDIPQGMPTVGMTTLQQFVHLVMYMHMFLAAVCALLAAYTVICDESSRCMLCLPGLMLSTYLLARWLRRRTLRQLLHEVTVTQLTTGADHGYVYTAVVEESARALSLNRTVLTPFVCALLGAAHTAVDNTSYDTFAIAVGCIGYAVITSLSVSKVFLTAVESVCNEHLANLNVALQELRRNAGISNQQQGGTRGNVQGNC